MWYAGLTPCWQLGGACQALLHETGWHLLHCQDVLVCQVPAQALWLPALGTLLPSGCHGPWGERLVREALRHCMCVHSVSGLAMRADKACLQCRHQPGGPGAVWSAWLQRSVQPGLHICLVAGGRAWAAVSASTSSHSVCCMLLFVTLR